MYIKEIKINGFKSFADKVNLELNRNFTGIVGPNGSGKSNIVDAIKWVMGEQSVKTLRGSGSMTDVIFNGSSSRPSSNSASVALVLDNTDKTLPLDYTEIEIKRIVYKTGDNEYYLNKEKVRLKDINDLFVDSFSSRESLSIIPQGKISAILEGKAEDRREIIEEAAGVVKYKRRKEETLRKLAKTNENIERVDMIINELSLNLEPLKEQARKAGIYKENKEKLESVEIGLLSTDIYNLSEEKNIITREREELENKLISDTTYDSKERTVLENLKNERTLIDNKLSVLQKELLSKIESITEISSKKDLLMERNKYDLNSNEVLNNINSIKENILKLSNDKESIIRSINEKEVTIKDISNKLNDINNEYNNLNKLNSTLNTEVNELTRKVYELSSKRDVLNFNIENMTKIPYSVKSVINNPSLKGIISTIGNLINIEDKYYNAIDVSLGSATNYVVTTNNNAAKEAINYLKRNNKGRVTFFPYDIIKGKNIDNETLNLIKDVNGFIDVASNLVKYDNKYKNIIDNQLGNIIVTDNIDNALVISKIINSRYRVVSLDGEIIHVGGSLTGGSSNKVNSNDKLELDKVINELNNVNINLNNKKELLKSNEEALNKIKDISYKTNLTLMNEKEQYNKLTIERESINNTINKSNDELNTLNGSKNESELDLINKEYYELVNDKTSLEDNIKSLEGRRTNIIEDIELKESTLRKLDSTNKEINDKINSYNLKEAKINFNLDNYLNRLNEEYSMTYEHARKNYELSMDIDEAREMINGIRKTIKNLGEVNLSSIDEYDRINKRYTFLTSQKEDLVNSENNLLEIINNMDDIMIDKFATTFKKVNTEFTKVFKELMGGGEAHMELTDPTDLLNTGIIIDANPPGKKPGNISLLSGGEKTLTAISLLFAVMNIKQVPFVILDEVESALDEVNVEKFGDYIKTYKGKTQLLVITHKKKTMEFLDLLYGITMQESGVSKLVSVKLEEIK